MVEEQVSFTIYHINIVSGCYIIISMGTRGCLKIFVVQEKGEQGSGGGGAVISQRHHKCSWYSNSGGGGCQEYVPRGTRVAPSCQRDNNQQSTAIISAPPYST